MKALSDPSLIAVRPEFSDINERNRSAESMLHAIKEDPYNCDWLKHNSALRQAAKSFGIKSSKDFRNKIKAMNFPY